MSGQAAVSSAEEIFDELDRLLETWRKAEKECELHHDLARSDAADEAYAKILQAFGSALSFGSQVPAADSEERVPTMRHVLKDAAFLPFKFQEVLQGKDGSLFFTGVTLTESIGHLIAGEFFRSAVISGSGLTLYKGRGRPWWRCSIEPQLSLGLGEPKEWGTGVES